MKRRILVLALLALCLTLVTGCVAKKPQKTEYSMNVGTGPGVWTVIGTAITELANKDAGLKAQGITITTIPGAGSVGNVLRVAQGEGEIGFSYSNFLKAAQLGVDPYDKKHTNLRTIAALGVQIVHFYGSKDLPVNSLREIVDRKFPLKLTLCRPGTGEYWSQSVLFPKYGIKLDDITAWGGKVDLLGAADGAEAYKDRAVDAVMSVTMLQGPQVQEGTMSRPSKFLTLDDKILDELVKEWDIIKFKIPAGTYPGQDKDVYTIAFPLILLVEKDVPDIVAYTLTKVICENVEHLATLNPMFQTWTPKNGPVGTGGELHPGAAKYYKEKGLL
jgi:TRAP transporter TAXI family solute receptor